MFGDKTDFQSAQSPAPKLVQFQTLVFHLSGLLFMNEPELTEIRERIAKFTSFADGDACWAWTGAISKTRGYGRMTFRGSVVNAHRVSYMAARGVELDRKICVCHRCDNPSCVRPDHLFEGTNKANTEDMIGKGRHRNQKKTHCKRGHPLSGDNLQINKNGSRHCKECLKITYRNFFEKNLRKTPRVRKTNLTSITDCAKVNG